MLCRGILKGFWTARTWSRMGVGYGLLVGLGDAARKEGDIEVKRKGIGRIRPEMEGVLRDACIVGDDGE